jgi:hypothetical protein
MMARGAIAGAIMSGISGGGAKGMLLGATVGASMGAFANIKNPVGKYAAQSSVNFTKGTLDGRMDGKSWGAAAKGAAINTGISLGADIGYNHATKALADWGEKATAQDQANKSGWFGKNSTIGVAAEGETRGPGFQGEHSWFNKVLGLSRNVEATSALHDWMGQTMGYYDQWGYRHLVMWEGTAPFGGFFRPTGWNFVGMPLAALVADRALNFELGAGGSPTETEKGIGNLYNAIHHGGGGDNGGGHGGGGHGGGHEDRDDRI